MRLIGISLFVVTIVVSNCEAKFSAQRISREWSHFKISHNKKYTTLNEEMNRRAIFIRNFLRVEEHNEKYEERLVNYKASINKLSDLTRDELNVMTSPGPVTLAHPSAASSEPRAVPNHAHVFVPPALENFEAPESLDWRTEALVSPVGDQGVCGSCWTFATCAAIETHMNIYLGANVTLSEQNLIDCVEKNHGCYGGEEWNVTNAWEYIIENGGIDTEESYPYYLWGPSPDGCVYNPEGRGSTLKGYGIVESHNEELMRLAVASVGPLSVNLNTVDGFYMYGGGIYYDNATVCDPTIRTHAVALVGYGTSSEDGEDYWIVKNSWGRWWGEEGFMRMRRNVNLCGIANDVTYPIIDPDLYPHGRFNRN